MCLSKFQMCLSKFLLFHFTCIQLRLKNWLHNLSPPPPHLYLFLLTISFARIFVQKKSNPAKFFSLAFLPIPAAAAHSFISKTSTLHYCRFRRNTFLIFCFSRIFCLSGKIAHTSNIWTYNHEVPVQGMCENFPRYLTDLRYMICLINGGGLTSFGNNLQGVS